MNGYKCFYKSKTAEIYAETTRAAQLKAAELWHVRESAVYMISAMLCEKADGADVVHAAIG